MSTLHKRVELLANIAIIAVAVLLGVVLVQRYLLAPAPPEAAQQARIEPGTKLSLPGVEWGPKRRTLLLALSTDCRYCTESAPFYQRLAQEKEKHDDLGLLAVLPQSIDESQKYLGEHGIKVDAVKQATPGSLNVRGTPTLILVDQTGAVVESWIGKLPPPKEVEVLNRFLVEHPGR